MVSRSMRCGKVAVPSARVMLFFGALAVLGLMLYRNGRSDRIGRYLETMENKEGKKKKEEGSVVPSSELAAMMKSVMSDPELTSKMGDIMKGIGGSK